MRVVLLGQQIVKGKERERVEQCSLIRNFTQMQIPNLQVGILIDFYSRLYLMFRS